MNIYQDNNDKLCKLPTIT